MEALPEDQIVQLVPPEPKISIVTCMPCFGDIHPLASKGYFAEMSKVPGRQILRLDPAPCSNMAHGFNRALCFALNMKLKGEATHFAMLHADTVPDPWWLDTLYDEMVRTGAHWIAAISPIKDSHGTTSTAIGYTNRWNPWARITMHEAHALPETFSTEALGENADQLGFKLLLNTGCMLIDLRPAYWDRVDDHGELEPHFEIRNRIVFVPGEGWQAQTETEDWMLSRILHGYGAKLVATRKVTVAHVGPIPFVSTHPWGEWQQDQAGHRAIERRAAEQAAMDKKIDPHGIWLEDLPDGELHDEALEQALVALCRSHPLGEYHLTVADLGCGKGWYVNALAKGGIPVIGVDGNPSVTQLTGTWSDGDIVPVYKQADLAEPLDVPAQYSDQLLDNVCRTANKQVIISWAVPGQQGTGHVNCQPNEWVQEQMERRGFIRNAVIEAMLRDAATLPYFKNTLMVYDRACCISVPCAKQAVCEDEGGTPIATALANEFDERKDPFVCDPNRRVADLSDQEYWDMYGIKREYDKS
jgi:hypothetical protein